jgi:hypothetical protein
MFASSIRASSVSTDRRPWSAKPPTSFKVRYEQVREPGAPADQYAVDHSAGMFLLGPTAALPAPLAYAMPAAEIVDQIREIMAEPAATGIAAPGQAR